MRTEGPDFDVFSAFKDGVDSVWLLGTDSSKAIDLLREVRFVGERDNFGYVSCPFSCELCARVWICVLAGSFCCW